MNDKFNVAWFEDEDGNVYPLNEIPLSINADVSEGDLVKFTRPSMPSIEMTIDMSDDPESWARLLAVFGLSMRSKIVRWLRGVFSRN